MKIREKIFIGFGIYVLLATIIGFFAFTELLTISTRLSLVETAHNITHILSELRRHEKNYLLYRQEETLQAFTRNLGQLKANIDSIKLKTEIVKAMGPGNYEMIKEIISNYEDFFNKVVAGIKLQEENILKLKVAGGSIENALSGNEFQIFSSLRRYEKDLMIYRDEKSYENFAKTFASLHTHSSALKEYRALTDRLYELYKKENDSVGNMRLKAREIELLLENLLKEEKVAIDSTMKKSMILLIFALLTIIVVGAAVNAKLAMSIAEPIKKLEEVTKKIAMGDFSETLDVKGKDDEIASLEMSFNKMETKLKQALGSLEDTIKQLQEKQSQLVEADKLASIGILASGIAHEISNPLTSVLTFSNLMLEKTPEGHPNRERLRMMVKETGRARDIVRQLLSFAKDEAIKPMRMNVNCPVTEICESLVSQEAFKDIGFALHLSENLPEIYADPARIGQVVSNILLNAIHSITPPGNIAVSTRVNGKFVEIIFSDTGHGIPAENLGKIFDPFFTTKDKEKGSGLGLAVSYGIIKKHGGDIDVSSEIEKGSTFTVRLPING
ncbi:MAG: ATP-binding protein [Nitrospirota bacterium]